MIIRYLDAVCILWHKPGLFRLFLTLVCSAVCSCLAPHPLHLFLSEIPIQVVVGWSIGLQALHQEVDNGNQACCKVRCSRFECISYMYVMWQCVQPHHCNITALHISAVWNSHMLCIYYCRIKFNVDADAYSAVLPFEHGLDRELQMWSRNQNTRILPHQVTPVAGGK